MRSGKPLPNRSDKGAETCLKELAARGSHDLQADMLKELDRIDPHRFVGLDVRLAWAELNQGN